MDLSYWNNNTRNNNSFIHVNIIKIKFLIPNCTSKK